MQQHHIGNTPNQKCIWIDNSDGVTISRCFIGGCDYEGVIGSYTATHTTLADCVADDCGNGGPKYAQSTAGFNMVSPYTRLLRCRTTRCGQGCETGNSHVTMENCDFGSPGAGTPSIGINIGSTNAGIWDVVVVGCTTNGYRQAVQIGNGNGRLAGVLLRDCVFADGGVAFQGGMTKNLVATPHEGPDLFGSAFMNCKVHFTNPKLASNNAGFIYSVGPSYLPSHAPTAATPKPPHAWGRAQLRVEDCSVSYDPGVADGSTPPFSMTGGITGTVEFVRCLVAGLDAPLTRGDFSAFDLGENLVQRPCRNLLIQQFNARDSKGVARAPRIQCADPKWTSIP
jgi:hypothetical protein